MIWFTADHHFGHEAIIRHCSRPYTSVLQMDFDLIERWNAIVGPDDTVWHLGDFAWKGHADTGDIFAALHGHKFLIKGNHDRRDVLSLPWAEPPRASWVLRLDGISVMLSHHPLAVPKGMVGLYGHMHGREPDLVQANALDVGVDAVEDRAPVSWGWVRQRLGV